MDSSKLTVKVFAANDTTVLSRNVVPVFHEWIQTRAIDEHLLVDVADYSHVPDGPGAVLVAHEANFYFDRLDGSPGLSYSRKQPLPGSFADRLRYALGQARRAAMFLQQHATLSGRLWFTPDRVSIRINDRLHAPNTIATFESIRADVERVLRESAGDATVRLDHRADPKRLLQIEASFAPPAVTA